MSRFTLLYILAFLAISFAYQNAPAQSSVLKTGDWYRFSVDKSGVYKIDRTLLTKAGVNVSGIDPRKIKIYGNRGGVLPQANSSLRPEDLTELAIRINGEDDGTFNSDDYILVYVEGPDKVEWSTTKSIHYYEHNIYDDVNYIFLTIGNDPGKRITSQASVPGTFPVITTFDDFIFHETEKYNILSSGRQWFGERFGITSSYSFSFDIDGLVPNSTLKVVSDVMAQSTQLSYFDVTINSTFLLKQNLLQINDPTVSLYSLRGQQRRDTVVSNTSSLGLDGAAKLEMKYTYSRSATAYLDFFLISIKRKLKLYGSQTTFTSSESLTNATSSFRIETAPASSVWDITNYYDPKLQQATYEESHLLFSTSTDDLRRFILVGTEYPQPVFTDRIQNQDLHGMAVPNLLIVSHPDFLEEANRLANHRQQHDGISCQVVTPAEIFNEFSSGRKDVSAIRDFARLLHTKSPGTFKNLLLFGRASYDYKDRLFNNTNFVLTYESHNSLHPLETYSSDDYFGLLDTNEGLWRELPPDYSTLDIGVGRIPCRTVEEARDAVDKLIAYDTRPDSYGPWRSRITFIADDGDTNIHNEQSDFLAETIETDHPEFNARKILVDAYPQLPTPNGEIIPNANKAIQDAIELGTLVINYTGHGTERLWAHERIFDDGKSYELNNSGKLPLFVTATCEFGRHEDPTQISSAEILVLRKDAGAIGMVSTARPVSSTTNFELNKAFYDAMFQTENNQHLTLGEIFRRTKNNSIQGVLNRNFSLLGDPSMTLAYPHYSIRVNKITSLSSGVVDTLSATGHIKVEGEIIDINDQPVPDFNGILTGLVYDKRGEFKTLGNENLPFPYKQWSNTLFRGEARVTDGQFSFDFIVPKNITYNLGIGKMSLYAVNETTGEDASGANLDFRVGKTELNSNDDTTAPSIQLFLNDRSFISGGATHNSPLLLADFHDENGISLSTYGIGGGLIAILDDEEPISVVDYYTAAENDYSRGQLSLYLRNISPGTHKLTVKAWDTFNNPGESSILFRVSDGTNLEIESFIASPNPFTTESLLSIAHNRAGDDLEVGLGIYDLSGKILLAQNYQITEAPYYIELANIDSGLIASNNLKAGLYLAKVVVRSLRDGSHNEKVTKIVLLN